jgi:hypothetical protein
LCFFLYLSSLSLLYQRIEISRKLITNWCVQQQKRLRIGGGRRWRRTIRSLGHGSDGWVKDGRGDTVQRLVDSLSLSSQFCLMRFRGGPIGGICWVAKTRKASASRWGWDRIIDFQPAVSITSVACLKQRGHELRIARFLRLRLDSSNFKRRKTDPKSSWDIKKNIRVDEVDGLGLELIGRVEIG